ncbi:MAG: hypothetical protein AAB368_07045 [bacterium]
MTKLQKLHLIEATHASDPQKMRNALLAELNPAAHVSPFRRLQAVASQPKPMERPRE